MVSGSLPAGSTIYLVNAGSIEGSGGNGRGTGVGSVGGDAISSSVNITIDNASGYILGGGGGGGRGGGPVGSGLGEAGYGAGGGGQVALVLLAQVGGVAVGHGALLAHPRDGG